jgi:hypothetical protein
MTHTRSMSAFLVVGLTLSLTHGAAAQTPSADEKALAAYELTMPVVRKAAAVTIALAEIEAKQKAADPTLQEMMKLQAQISAIEDKDERTEAEEKQLDKLYERQQALEEERQRADEAEDAKSDGVDNNNSQTLAGMEAAFKKQPEAMRLLAAQGLSSREYWLCMMALMQAAMVEDFSQGKADLKALPPGVNPDNLRFIRENKAELEKLQSEMARASKK